MPFSLITIFLEFSFNSSVLGLVVARIISSFFSTDPGVTDELFELDLESFKDVVLLLGLMPLSMLSAISFSFLRRVEIFVTTSGCFFFGFGSKLTDFFSK